MKEDLQPSWNQVSPPWRGFCQWSSCQVKALACNHFYVLSHLCSPMFDKHVKRKPFYVPIHMREYVWEHLRSVAFRGQSLVLAFTSLFEIGSPVPCCAFQTAGSQASQRRLSLFMGVLGGDYSSGFIWVLSIQLRHSYLNSKHFMHGTISLAPESVKSSRVEFYWIWNWIRGTLVS